MDEEDKEFLEETLRLRKNAEYWFNQGFNIVLLNGKHPLHEWRRWINQRQTREEFNSLPWDRASQYGVVCGLQGENGFYLGVVDYDVKNLPPEIVEKGRKALKQLPITRIEETPSGGLHYVYFSRTQVKTLSMFHNECGLELLGEGKLCIMAPSRGYRNLNDNPPTVLENLEFTFLDLIDYSKIFIPVIIESV